MPPIIGIDFDNTIACYTRIFRETAAKLNLLSNVAGTDKAAIRDALRNRPGGEMQWRALQAQVYGPGLASGRLFPGVANFFRQARQRGIPVYIISHKTRFAGGNRQGVNLRKAARQFMRSRRFFQKAGLGLSPGQVYFEPSRAEKVQRIASLGCTHFIDDLPETFMETTFPAATVKLLFDPTGRQPSVAGVQSFKTWKKLEAFFFA